MYRPASSLLETNYERTMHELVRDGTLLDHSKSPCDRDFIPATSPPTNFVAFFKHNPLHENGGTFRKILKCLKVWDLDNRGLHKGAFRTFISGQHVLLVGCPLSPYSIYKPVHVKPIELWPLWVEKNFFSFVFYVCTVQLLTREIATSFKASCQVKLARIDLVLYTGKM